MYVFNNLDGGDFIPFYGGIHAAMKKRHGGSIIFGGDGRVKDFNWNETDPACASVEMTGFFDASALSCATCRRRTGRASLSA